MERLTEYHNGVAVIRDKALLKDAMRKLAGYEDAEELSAENGIEKITTEFAEYICDMCCGNLDDVRSQEEADVICDECKLGKFICDICNKYNEIDRFAGSELEKVLKKKCELERELKSYKDLEEQGLLLKLPCKVGDVVYLIDEDENRHLKVYEGVWTRVSIVQRSVDGNFELCGHISYDIYDCFYNDGRTMKHGMYVGQDRTRVGEIVFLTKAEAEKALAEMEK